MFKKSAAHPAELTASEKQIMGLMYEKYYFEMYNKTMKYTKDHEMRHDIVITSLESVARRSSAIKIESLKGFLYVTIVRKAFRVVKAAGRYSYYEPMVIENKFHQQGVVMESSAYDEYAYRDLINIIEHFLYTLSPAQLRLYNLITESGESYKDIAALTKKTVDQVKANWWLIKKKLYLAVYK